MEFAVYTRLIWGIAVMLLFSFVLWKRAKGYRVHRDGRSKRDLLEAFALFLVAGPACLSIFFFIFNGSPNAVSSASSALALGMFVGLGIIMATEETARPS